MIDDADEDETFMPAVQTINPLAGVPTTDRKALIIRLELNYYDYGRLEELAQFGIDHHTDRYTELGKLAKDAKDKKVELPFPLTPEDVEVAQRNQGERLMAAKTLIFAIRRPLQ